MVLVHVLINQSVEAMEEHMLMNAYWILHLVGVEGKSKKLAMENAVSDLLTSN